MTQLKKNAYSVLSHGPAAVGDTRIWYLLSRATGKGYRRDLERGVRPPAQKLLCSLEQMTATRVEQREKKEWARVCWECSEMECLRWWPGTIWRGTDEIRHFGQQEESVQGHRCGEEGNV